MSDQKIKMITFEKHTLKNGLMVIVHPDYSTPMAAMNIIYNVGSKDENPDKKVQAIFYTDPISPRSDGREVAGGRRDLDLPIDQGPRL